MPTNWTAEKKQINSQKNNLPRKKHEEVENLKRHIISQETGAVIKNLPTNKCPLTESLLENYIKHFKKELTPMLLKLFQNIEEKGTCPSSFNEANITLTPKTDMTTKLQNNILDKH